MFYIIKVVVSGLNVTSLSDNKKGRMEDKDMVVLVLYSKDYLFQYLPDL